MESIILKLNKTQEYLNVSFNTYQIIDEVRLVKNRNEATLFQNSALIIENEKGDKFSLGAKRMTEVSLYMHYKGIKAHDLTIIKFDAPEQGLLTDKQIKDIDDLYPIK